MIFEIVFREEEKVTAPASTEVSKVIGMLI